MKRTRAIHYGGYLAILLSVSGCKSEGTGGLLSLFDLGGSAGGSSQAASGVQHFGAQAPNVLALDGGSSASDIDSAATVHHPEPASMALFGGGLMGMAAWRRRKMRKR